MSTGSANKAAADGPGKGNAVSGPKADGKSPQRSSKPNPGDEPLVIRGYSKVVFFWPLAAVSLLFFFVSGGWWFDPLAAGDVPANAANLETIHTLGLWWMIVFAFNLLVFGYDFGRSNFITFVVSVVAVVLAITILDFLFSGSVWGGVIDFFGGLKIRLNAYFYLCVASILSFFLGLAWINSRFDTWTISSNELIHKHGFLGDVRAYSTIHMHVEKEIPDVFEWLLFGSGRLIFKPGNATTKGEEVLIVENVFRINRAEKRVKDAMAKWEVS